MDINRIKEMRKERKLSQKEVANLLKITQQQYSIYETKERLIPIDKLCILADFYNVNLDYLTGRTNERKPYSKSKIY